MNGLEKKWNITIIILSVALIIYSCVFTRIQVCNNSNSLPVMVEQKITIPSSRLPLPGKHFPDKQIKVLLVTAFRSGSTFTGQLLNMNDDTFYLFEPLMAIQREQSTLGCDKNGAGKIDLLKRYYDCHSPELLPPDQIPTSNRNYVTKTTRSNYCTNTNICFRDRNKWACRPEVCYFATKQQVAQTLAQTRDLKKGCMGCAKLTPSIIDSVCQSKDIIALKVIRLCDIDDVIELVGQIPDLKVIITFRDPRGIYRSRKDFIPPPIRMNELLKTCHSYAKILFRRKELDEKNFFFIRYEDIALDQMAMAKRIYQFIGSYMGQSVQKWIIQNGKKLQGPHGSQGQEFNNSTYTTTKWRYMLGIDEIQNIQLMCSGVFTQLGYVLIPDEETLHNPKFEVLRKSPL